MLLFLCQYLNVITFTTSAPVFPCKPPPLQLFFHLLLRWQYHLQTSWSMEPTGWPNLSLVSLTQMLPFFILNISNSCCLDRSCWTGLPFSAFLFRSVIVFCGTIAVRWQAWKQDNWSCVQQNSKLEFWYSICGLLWQRSHILYQAWPTCGSGPTCGS